VGTIVLVAAISAAQAVEPVTTLSDRFILGWGDGSGARTTAFPYAGAPTGREGEFAFVYGGGPEGRMTFIHDQGPDAANRWPLRMSINKDGNVSMAGDLSVTGTISSYGQIRATEVLVALSKDWPDYVFDPDYSLMSLEDLKDFIEANGHLPGVPTAEDVSKRGISLGEVGATLIEKVEELTLHVIELNEQNEALKKLLDEK
jgi:hypothetical protein